MEPSFVLVVTVVVGVIIVFALHSKGDVRAGLKVLGVEISLDAKEKLATERPATAPMQPDKVQ